MIQSLRWTDPLLHPRHGKIFKLCSTLACLVITSYATLSFLLPVAHCQPLPPAAQRAFPFQDYHLSVDDRVHDLVARLTLEEKISLLVETASAIPRLNVSEYHYGNEALHGVVRPGQFTVFPQSIGLASSWDPELIQAMSTAISDEARGRYNADKGKMETGGRFGGLYNGLLTFWSPTINMARDPRWGRTAETYGEDPYLTSRLAVAFIHGLQGDDPNYLKVVATPKHFALYNEEFDRFQAKAVASTRVIHEYYLPAFQAAIIEGHAESIMSSYNAINGVPSSANHWLLTDVLRNDWNFSGYVVTDCGATPNLVDKFHIAKSPEEASAMVINAGVDLECGGLFSSSLERSVGEGLVSIATVDRAATNVLLSRFKLGMFDPPSMVPFSSISADTIGSDAHESLAFRAAQESLVLLRNAPQAGHPLLPVNRAESRSIAIIGPYASVAQLGDYSGIPAHHAVSPLEGLRALGGASQAIRAVDYLEPSTSGHSRPIPSTCLHPSGAAAGIYGLTAEYFDKADFSGSPTRRLDAAVDFDWFNIAPDPLVKPGSEFSVRWIGTLVSPLDGSFQLVVTTDDEARLLLDGKSLLEAPAVPVNRDSKPLERWPKSYTAHIDLKAGEEHRMELEYSTHGGSVVHLEWLTPELRPGLSFAREVEAARSSDLTIAFLGFGVDAGMEGKDRANLDLAPDQQQLIEEVAAANPRTIVVLVSGGPLAVGWIASHVPALIEAWYPGEQGGNAIASLIYGDTNAGGRLPLTFYQSSRQLPDFQDYEISHGRTYQYLRDVPLYPFGFGLSYSTFKYSNLKVHQDAKAMIDVDFDLSNTSGQDGDEVAQLYFHRKKVSSGDPIRRLGAFRRVPVARGQTMHVKLPLSMDSLRDYDETAKRFEPYTGEIVLEVGSSSADVRLLDSITLPTPR